ncbi:hypothetical protein CPB84DRAFT_1809153 [Gymnopilus junonius]|uniref:Uncharacterized protein n=1 Tax=Gymnopilus junonius TaxID=109634 RepID=A0A9P5N6G9_GYMJU|nr:hypothetical protein CPB84DRAFT_1809153 [Gymnopilus junonius]
MAALTVAESIYLSTALGGILYGIYCVIFIQYLNLRNKAVGNTLLYPLCALFLLGSAFVAIGYAQGFFYLLRPTAPGTDVILFRLRLSTSTIYSFADLISQGVLIYRCWIVWGKHLLVIVIPSTLAVASFVTDIVLVAELGVFGPAPRNPPDWFTKLGTSSFSISLATNTIVTAILVLKLLIVHRELEGSGVKGDYLSTVVSILIESGALTFISQLIWVVLFSLQNITTGFDAVGALTALACGIAPTAVIVRVAMGRSYESRLTHVESTLHFQVRDNYDTSITTGTVGQTAQKSLNATRVDNSTEKLEKQSV